MSPNRLVSKRRMLPSSRRVSSYRTARSILRSKDFSTADLLTHLQNLQQESGADLEELLAWVSGSLEFQTTRQHRMSRRLLARHFGASTIKQWQPRMECEVRAALSRLVNAPQPDLVQDFAIPLVTALIPAILGIRPEAGNTWVDQANCIRGLVEPCLSLRQLLKIQQACHTLLDTLDDSGQWPIDNTPAPLLARLIHDERSGVSVAQKKLLVANLAIGALAIVETLPKIAWAIFADDSSERIDEDASAWADRNLERMLRLHASTSLLGRVACKDVRVEGDNCYAGEHLAIDIPAVNRDPSRFPPTASGGSCPHKESANAHLAFGVGAHKCPGADLGRTVLGIAVKEMLLLTPAPRIIAAEVRWQHSVMASYPIYMPVQPFRNGTADTPR